MSLLVAYCQLKHRLPHTFSVKVRYLLIQALEEPTHNNTAHTGRGNASQGALGLVPQLPWCNTLKYKQKALPATFVLVSKLKEV